MLTSIRSKPYYKPVIWIAAAICFILLIQYGIDLSANTKWFLGGDFMMYWAAGQLNLFGNNPYNPQLLINLQNEVGIPSSGLAMMWNPPWTLLFMMPFGYILYPLSRIFWLLVSIVIIFVSVNTLWDLFEGNKRMRWISWLLGFSFIPTLILLRKGQIGFLILLGVVGFLYFINRKNYWMAGISLALLLVKPHLGYLFLLAVVIWSIHIRAWPVIWGCAITILFATSLAWALNPNVIGQYLIAVSSYIPLDSATPTLGGIMRLFLGFDKSWLQFLPQLFGVIWLIIYWKRNAETWNWLIHAPIVILVSMVTAVYYWSFDQPVLLVAIIQVFAIISVRKLNYSFLIIIASYILLNLLSQAALPIDFWLFWLAPALLIWYLISIRYINKPEAITQSPSSL